MRDCAPRSLPGRGAFLESRGRHLRAEGEQKQKKDVTSYTFLDLEVASQEIKECRSWGTGLYTKMDFVIFFGVLRGFFFPLHSFSSPSLRFAANQIDSNAFVC